MKSIFIKDLIKNQIIESETFAVYESEKMQDKNGKPYYKILLGDKTGRIQAKIWNDRLPDCDLKALEIGKIIRVSGKVDEYKGSFQLTIFSASQVDEGALDDFLASSKYNADDMFQELLKEISELKDDGIKKVFHNIFSDTQLVAKFKYAVAASSIHHGFRSGLLQHILEMITISKSMKRFYPEINYDVLTAGIILHDIGKLEELDSSGLGTIYTKKGGLIGHIVLGVMLFEKYGGHELPENTFLHICHLILSHHGAIDMGSPVLPATAEALMLTNIDNLSSKSRSALDQVESIPEGSEFGKPYLFLQNARFWSGAKPASSDSQDSSAISNKGDSLESAGDQIESDLPQLFE